MAEEWLSSRLKLCRLTSSPKIEQKSNLNVQDSPELVINTQSYLQPEYDQSSIFHTMEAYSGAIDKARVRISDLTTECRDHNIPQCVPDQTGILHRFAEMLSGDILDAAVRTRGTRNEKGTELRTNKSCHNAEPNQVTMAKRLASEIYNSALDEVARHGVLKDGQCELSDTTPKQMNVTKRIFKHQDPEMDVDPRTDEFDNTHHHDRVLRDTCSGSTTFPNPLNDLVNMGSLDYPDAPPSTPLLPEMIKSRASFSRKLKGGLANEFLPSPPPPTPKDHAAESMAKDETPDADDDDKSEFVVRLMRSLSLACSQDLDQEEDDRKEDEGRFRNAILTLSDYAAHISADIIHCLNADQLGSKINRSLPLRGAQGLADRLAEEIVITSVAESTGSKREHHIQTSNSGESRTQDLEILQGNAGALPCSLLPVSKLDAIEPLRALAGRLIAKILVLAFSELAGGASLPTTSRPCSDVAAEPIVSESETFQSPNSHLNARKSHPSPQRHNSTSDPKYTIDSRAVMSMAAHFLAQNIAQEVLDCSIQQASISLSNGNQMNVNSDTHCSLNAANSAGQCVLRGVISDQTGVNVQQLACVLLWAAASHMGVPAIHLDLPDSLIQQQLSSLSVRAQLRAWTVGDLIASVLIYCEDLQTASRGHLKSSGSLLGHLLLLLMEPQITQ